MNKTPKYFDFDDMLEICDRLIESSGKCQKSIRDLKKELNRFFKDCDCKDLIVTQNTDKLFFGAMVVPTIRGEAVTDILFNDNPIRIVEYSIELDSKLFDPILNINSRELVAIILHEVGHVVNTSEPIEDIRHILDEYCAKNHEELKVVDSIHYKELLAYGMKEYVAKRDSLFAMRDDEILADEFVHSFGFGPDLENIMDRIASQGFKINNAEIPPYVTLIWTLQIYKNVKMRRIGALKTLSRAKSIIASKLEKMEIEGAIRRLNRMDDMLGESVVDLYQGKLQAIKARSLKKTMKQFVDDFYEINMRARNLEEEDDALYLMRQINTRISIIDECLHEPLSDSDRKYWDRLLDKYKKLREKISNTHVYKNKSYGIFIKYPEIRDNNY